MLYATPSAPTPIGAITGMKSRESRSWISSGSMRSISPTRPMSTISPSAGVALQQHLARMDERAVLPGEADGLAAVLVDEADDLLVQLAQHHLDDVHHALVGDAHALAELALDAHLLQQVADLRAAAVDDDGIHPDELQHHDVAGEAGLQRRLDHRVAAVLDDDRLVVEALDVRQRLGKDLRLHGGIDGVDRHGGRAAGGTGRGTRDRLYRKRRTARSGTPKFPAGRASGGRVSPDCMAPRRRRSRAAAARSLLSLPVMSSRCATAASPAFRRPRSRRRRPPSAARGGAIEPAGTDAPRDRPPGLPARRRGRARHRAGARGAARAQCRHFAVHAIVAADPPAADRAGDHRSVPSRRAVARLGIRARGLPRGARARSRASSSRTSACSAATSTAPRDGVHAVWLEERLKRAAAAARHRRAALAAQPVSAATSSGASTRARGCAP